MLKYILLISLFVSGQVFGQVDVEALDAAAVTIKSNTGQGSGSIILKEMIVDEDGTKANVAFVLTAAHVISGHRSVSTKIVNGEEKKVIAFSDPGILQELYLKGRRIGEVKLDAKVVRYSDADKGHDIAVLLVYARDKFNNTVSFVQDKDYIPPKGMKVIHIGSSNGQVGSNSFTVGNISQTGRLLSGIGMGSGVVFDQTSAPAEPGSSGCMIVREEDGKYVGMLVRGGSSTFNFVVPIRRIYDWSKSVDLQFLFDESAEVPTLDEVLDSEVEGVSDKSDTKDTKEKSIINTIFFLENK